MIIIKKILIPFNQISEIYSAMTSHNYLMDDGYETNSYLDTDSGEVLYISSPLICAISEVDKLLDEITEDDLPGDVDPDDLEPYKKIEQELGKKYLELPEMEGWHGYNDMQSFIEEEENQKLKSALTQSIQGKGAFSRFKSVLEHYPGKIDEWYHFEALNQLGRIQKWLSCENIILEILSE